VSRRPAEGVRQDVAIRPRASCEAARAPSRSRLTRLILADKIRPFPSTRAPRGLALFPHWSQRS